MEFVLYWLFELNKIVVEMGYCIIYGCCEIGCLICLNCIFFLVIV